MTSRLSPWLRISSNKLVSWSRTSVSKEAAHSRPAGSLADELAYQYGRGREIAVAAANAPREARYQVTRDLRDWTEKVEDALARVAFQAAQRFLISESDAHTAILPPDRAQPISPGMALLRSLGWVDRDQRELQLLIANRLDRLQALVEALREEG